MTYGSVAPFDEVNHHNDKVAQCMYYVMLFLVVVLFALPYCFVSSLHAMTPTRYDRLASTNNTTYLYMIRHAEKIHDWQFGLSVEGSIHALCYTTYFRGLSPKPNLLMAQMSRSERSVLTALPIAFEMELPLYTERRLPLADLLECLYSGANVLVVADHDTLVLAAQHLGCTTCLSWSLHPNVSNDNDPSLYNSIWRLGFFNGRFIDFAIDDTFSFSGLSTTSLLCPNATYQFV